MEKFKLDVYYKDPKSAYMLLKHMILTFRINLKDLSYLYGLSEAELLSNLLKYNSKDQLSFSYLFNYDEATLDEESLTSFVSFYQKLAWTIKNGKKSEVAELIHYVDDKKYNDLIRERKNNSHPLRSEEVPILVSYELKYAKPIRDVAILFETSYSTARVGIYKYLKSHDKLSERFRNLLSYNISKKGQKLK